MLITIVPSHVNLLLLLSCVGGLTSTPTPLSPVVVGVSSLVAVFFDPLVRDDGSFVCCGVSTAPSPHTLRMIDSMPFLSDATSFFSTFPWSTRRTCRSYLQSSGTRLFRCRY